MHGSNLPLRIWAIGIYIVLTNLKGVSSTKLANDLGITQKSAWYMLMRIRESYTNDEKLDGIIELDEVYIGGKEKTSIKTRKQMVLKGVLQKQKLLYLL